jgi:hypothetical protein
MEKNKGKIAKANEIVKKEKSTSGGKKEEKSKRCVERVEGHWDHGT